MVIRKVIGQVTPEERNEIQQLFERRNGLNELAKILTDDNAELYEKPIAMPNTPMLTHES